MANCVFHCPSLVSSGHSTGSSSVSDYSEGAAAVRGGATLRVSSLPVAVESVRTGARNEAGYDSHSLAGCFPFVELWVPDACGFW